VTKILYHWLLLLDQFHFCEAHFTTYQRFVSDQSSWTDRSLAVHEWVDSRFLILAGSESTITEITEYRYFLHPWWTERCLAVNERVDSQFLVLVCSELTITEITEYRYFSLLKPIRELKYKSE